MSSNCKHPTCFDSDVCRRSVAPRSGRSPIVYKPKPKEETIITADEQHRWFIDRAAECINVCCCCGGPSSVTSGVYWKWSIAHVFPKDPKYGFPSVATHPDNFIELCIQCHTLYDRSLHVAHTLPCWKYAVEKFLKFQDCITEKRKFLDLFIHYSNG